MEVREALLRRRSVRKFTSERVDLHDVEELLHAAMSAPSACNATPWEFYVVTDPDALARLRGATRYSNIAAPLAVVVCGDLTRALPGSLAPFWVQDCSAATENLLLRAVELGLGGVWCGVHPQKNAEQAVSEALSLPEHHVPLNILYLGHPAEAPAPRDQYREEFVHFVR